MLSLKRVVPILAILIIGIGIAQPRKVVLDRVVAVVGNSSILYSELKSEADALVERRRRQGQTSDRDPMNEALEEMLTIKLLANQSIIDSVEVNTANIAAQVDERVKTMVVQAGGIVELEQQYGMEIFNIRERLRLTSEEAAQAQAMRSDVIDNLSIVPGEVEQFYKRMDKDKIPEIGEQYMYAQITKLPSSLDAAKLRVKENLLDMRERIVTGKTSFKALAQMYSIDPGSAYKGGEMDPQPSSAFVPSFAEALEALKPGQVSELVESEFGFHIIELIDKKNGMYHCRHILLKPVYTSDELNEPIRQLDSLVNLIRLDSITFEKAAKLHSDDKSSKMNGGIVTNHDMLERYNAYDAKLTVTKFLKEDFGARGYKSIDDFRELSKLKKGEVSNAFSTSDMLGNQLSKVVKLVDVIPAHKASLEEDYLRLEELAMEDKENRVFEKWLNRHIASMYVYVDPEFRSSEFENKNWLK